MGRDKGHASTYLVANAGDQTYWAYCKKYTDAHETSFKREIQRLTNNRQERITVQHRKTEPTRGIKIGL